MEFQDDRTEDQKKTHIVLIGGTDRFMSGWGRAEGGKSYAFWACTTSDESRVERWVRNRGDITRVRQVSSDYTPPSGPGHCHVYVVTETHPALQ
jgi:hypothetical protein